MNDKEEMIIVEDNPDLYSHKPTANYIGAVGQGKG